MIGLARIQNHKMGFPSFQRPVIQALGQNGNGNGNGGPSPSPSPSPAPSPAPSNGNDIDFFPVFPPVVAPPPYVYAVTEPAPTQLPSWAPLALAAAAGTAVLVVVVNAVRKG